MNSNIMDSNPSIFKLFISFLNIKIKILSNNIYYEFNYEKIFYYYFNQVTT